MTIEINQIPEDVPASSGSQPKKEKALLVAEHLYNEFHVEKLRVFNETLKPVSDIIYYPFCGTDTSPSKVFSSSNVIYVDEVKSNMEVLKKNGYNAYCADAFSFLPENVIDLNKQPNILLLLNNPATGMDPLKVIKHVAEGGYVITDGRSGDERIYREAADFKLVGLLTRDRKSNKIILDTKNLDDCYRKVESDEELRIAPRRPILSASYDKAAEVVLQITGKKTSILGEYIKLQKEAEAETLREEQKIALPEIGYMPQLPHLILIHKEKKYSLSRELPYKRGAYEDMYVFQKIKK